MYCRNCGKPIDRQAAVCLNCGVESGDGTAYCQNCGTEIAPDTAVCVGCGSTISYPIKSAQGKQPRSKILALLLAIFGGQYGLHNFYMGHVAPGIVQFFLTVSVVLRLKNSSAALALASGNESGSVSFGIGILSGSIGIPLAPLYRAMAANASPIAGGWFASVLILIISLAVRIWSLVEGVHAYQGKRLDSNGIRLR